ncbi:SUN domain-containing protein 1 isoform X10 [Microcebus murinus]|uniref:SUN domain-containing protein 1 isoform X10 n=1 Tax=Microcebus murinus TaxID=30608 RepID=UPI0006437824|nr:SUN domain-containing protein 1 isoform X9 [Microcebus murinus]
MDFSRLHMYTPPQCVPENSGYTYALSSSYSSDALDFETEHKLDPVFDSPRMSRRSLRLVTTAHPSGDGQAMGAHSCTSSAGSLKDGVARTVKQRRSANKVAFSINHVSRQVTSSGASQGGSKSLQGAVSLRPPVLDESLIREQTKVDHFWGLDDDGDLKGGNKAAIQGNGDLAAGAAARNGYICSDCSMLSERRDALTAHSTAHGLTSRIYSRDRDQKRKAASGMFWWLGIGWYQFVTLISWLNVFLLTRCLRNFCKFLILFIPLLLLLGLSSWGQGDFLSFLPVLNWTNLQRTQSADDPGNIFKPEASHLNQPPQGDDEAFRWRWTRDVEQQVASLSGQCHSHDERLRELTALLEKLQAQVDQMDDGRAGLPALVRDAVGQHLWETDFMTFHQEHEVRISNLEDILGKLTEKSEAIQKELEQTKLKTTSSSGADEQQLMSTVRRLELELGHLRSELSSWQHEKTSCEKVDVSREKVDAQVRETLKLIFSEDQQDDSLEWLLQKFSSQFVRKDDLQILLQDLELKILKNITHHISVTKQMPTSETVMSAVNEAGVSGITEAQAHVIVNNALKLYSQDKTGMVDFALESGGGSILSTRCSETYETKTALISLFGIPLWYFSQSPRVVIQPDMYPGNCWAFKGSQGYLVVRLSMVIHPTAVTLEHIPKTLSPTGNITSAPKDFAVYGLENEYQEEGWLLGHFTYDHEGESLQTFHVLKRPERAFQVVELRIFSNWGHPEYTCLYRFRVHGEPVK